MAENSGGAPLGKCELCDATTLLHKWAKVRARDAGWFENKEGKWWCPLHVPDWVAKWRADKKAAKGS